MNTGATLKVLTEKARHANARTLLQKKSYAIISIQLSPWKTVQTKNGTTTPNKRNEQSSCARGCSTRTSMTYTRDALETVVIVRVQSFNATQAPVLLCALHARLVFVAIVLLSRTLLCCICVLYSWSLNERVFSSSFFTKEWWQKDMFFRPFFLDFEF